MAAKWYCEALCRFWFKLSLKIKACQFCMFMLWCKIQTEMSAWHHSSKKGHALGMITFIDAGLVCCPILLLILVFKLRKCFVAPVLKQTAFQLVFLILWTVLILPKYPGISWIFKSLFLQMLKVKKFAIIQACVLSFPYFPLQLFPHPLYHPLRVAASPELPRSSPPLCVCVCWATPSWFQIWK